MINPYTNPQLKNSYQKTILAIKSCKSIIQLDGANRMIKNFKELYEMVGYPKILSYSLDREFKIKEKYILQKWKS
tara:strand:+ start:533 stop:757 length:225 start_codon:yes stop_codon:yes gene_type:complete